MKGRFPIVVLQIQVHPSAVDVNVHPTKSEVKFRQPELVGRTIERAVRAALQQTVVIQGWQPELDSLDADASDSDMPTLEPAGDRRDEPEPRAQAADEIVDRRSPATYREDRRDVEIDDPEPLQSEGRFQPPAQPAPGYRPPFVRDMSLVARPTKPDRDEDDRMPAAPRPPVEPTPVQAALIDPDLHYAQPDARLAPRQVAEQRWPERPIDRADDAPEVDQIAGQPQEARPSRLAAALPIAAQPDSAQPAMRLPPLRALAQLAQTYLLTEGPNGALFLIDQHAAHERITYERLLAQHAAGVLQSQTLLLPQYVALPPSAQQALLGAAHELADWGFALAEADGGVDVQAVPADLALETLATTLPDLASHLGGSAGHGPNARRDAMLATLACHTSVRAGQTLTPIEQQALIDQLAGCEGPRTCPHGRPTLIVLTKHQLEHQFGRLGA
jgi:DNA mismatch repair ATPase MutL